MNVKDNTSQSKISVAASKNQVSGSRLVLTQETEEFVSKVSWGFQVVEVEFSGDFQPASGQQIPVAMHHRALINPEQLS